jgi:hypothetical protein
MLDRIFQLTAKYQRHIVQRALLRGLSYDCAQLGLVLWQLFTQARPQNHNTLTYVRSIYYFLLYVSVNRVTIIKEKELQVQKVHSSSLISSRLFIKDLTTFTAPFELDF